MVKQRGSRRRAATAVELAEHLVAGQYDRVRENLTHELQQKLSVAQLAQGWETVRSRFGAVRQLGLVRIGTEGPERDPGMVTVPVICDHGDFNVVVALDDELRVTALYLRAAQQATTQIKWTPPTYADPNTLREHEIRVAAHRLVVDGILTVPSDRPNAPAVVLLAGSGPMDRDGTIGPNKPLKDIAWGLASNGIASVRYDKPTLAHPQHFAYKHDVTIDDEYLEHALAAIEMLRTRPGIDPKRIYLLGHSQGGTVAPRIAEKGANLAGLIIMAGAVQPPHRAALRQIRYLTGLRPDADIENSAAVRTLSDQADAVDSPQLSASTPASELPFGVPATYWIHLRDYDAVGTAAGLDLPMLILQGGRDYQVTVDDDLVHWQARLADRSNVCIRVYPAGRPPVLLR